MRAVLTEPFVRSLIAAPPEIPKLFGKQLAHLLRDRRHRSLDAKKFPESGDPNVWSARVNDDRRFHPESGHRVRNSRPLVAIPYLG